MSDWKPKRFWKTATVVAHDGGFGVLLDHREIRTPGKAQLIVPTRAIAEAIAAEWDAQEKLIDPDTMPATRSANSAIDKVPVQRDEIIALLADYGDSDLLCYRAEGPDGLVKRQAEMWDPLLEWAATGIGAHLTPVKGVMHVPQDPDALELLKAELSALDDFALVAIHDLISLSGSLVLALAVTKQMISAEDAWRISRLDEHWQAEQWGQDEEALAAELIKRAAFLDAARFYRLSRN